MNEYVADLHCPAHVSHMSNPLHEHASTWARDTGVSGRTGVLHVTWGRDPSPDCWNDNTVNHKLEHRSLAVCRKLTHDFSVNNSRGLVYSIFL
jgi:hypothetical protein